MCYRLARNLSVECQNWRLIWPKTATFAIQAKINNNNNKQASKHIVNIYLLINKITHILSYFYSNYPFSFLFSLFSLRDFARVNRGEQAFAKLWWGVGANDLHKKVVDFDAAPNLPTNAYVAVAPPQFLPNSEENPGHNPTAKGCSPLFTRAKSLTQNTAITKTFYPHGEQS